VAGNQPIHSGTMTPRRAVLVLGMHRSGTSAVAGLLAHCGLQAPRTLIPANRFNANGYFESAVFRDFHDRLLQTAGTRWDAYTRIDPGWLASGAAVRFKDECGTLLAQEFGSDPQFVLKDPRICRLLPFWVDVLATGSIEVSAVLVLRHPLEIAASLAERDQLSQTTSLLVWLRHVLEAESASRPLKRTTVTYDALFADWRKEIARMAEDLSASWLVPPDNSAAADAFVRGELRHHRAADHAKPVPPLLLDWMQRTWTALLTLNANDGVHDEAARRVLDTIRLEFDAAVETFGVDDEKLRVRAAENIATLNSTIARLEAERRHVDALDEQIAALEVERQQMAGHVGALERQCANLEAERAALLSSLSWRLTAPLRMVFRGIREAADNDARTEK
jgi:hypothetical protein